MKRRPVFRHRQSSEYRRAIGYEVPRVHIQVVQHLLRSSGSRRLVNFPQFRIVANTRTAHCPFLYSVPVDGQAVNVGDPLPSGKSRDPMSCRRAPSEPYASESLLSFQR